MLIRYAYWAVVIGILLGILINAGVLHFASAIGLWLVIMSAYVALEFLTHIKIRK